MKNVLDDQGESRQKVLVVVLEASKVSAPVKFKTNIEFPMLKYSVDQNYN